MKKLLVLLVGVMLISSMAYASDPFSVQDEECKRVAEFVKASLNPGFENTLKTRFPEVKSFEWGARAMAGTEGEIGATYIVYCEGLKENGSAGYWYIEVKITAVNGNEKLKNKYNL